MNIRKAKVTTYGSLPCLELTAGDTETAEKLSELCKEILEFITARTGGSFHGMVHMRGKTLSVMIARAMTKENSFYGNPYDVVGLITDPREDMRIE